MWQPRYYNLLTEKKRIRKFTILISRNSLQTSSLDDILSGNLSLSNSIISMEDQIIWKRGFEIFLIDQYAGGIRKKNIAGKC